MEKPSKIDEKTTVPVSFMVLFITGGFALFVLVAGAVFWGGVLQAKADNTTDRVNKVEIKQEQFIDDFSKMKHDIAEIKIMLQLQQIKPRN